jgi:phosphoglycolate phosphatase
MEEAGQAPLSSSAIYGENGASPHSVIEHVPELHGNMSTPWGHAAGYSNPAQAGKKGMLLRQPGKAPRKRSPPGGIAMRILRKTSMRKTLNEKQILVLWDVDGTLVTAGGGSRRAMESAARHFIGESFSLDAIDLRGRLDPDIWAEIAFRFGGGKSGFREEDFRTTYLESLKREFALNSVVDALPGVRALIGRLEREGNITQGILSGNYPEVGRWKLEAAGLPPGQFAVFAWGTDGITRRDLVPAALARYREITRRPIGAKQTIIIGDTLRDVECARINGCRCLAVATGIVPIEDLEKAGADLVQTDLTDTETIMRWIRA